MYQNIKAIDKRAGLKYTAHAGFHFAAAETFCPVFIQELPEIIREYFVFFPNNQTDMPHALLSFQKNRNMYVTGGGVWQADYIPAYIRRYPFILAKAGEASKQPGDMAVAADMEAPHFNRREGESLFTGEGNPTDLFINKIEFLKALERQRVITQKAVKEIEAAGLFTMQEITVKQKDATVAAIGGARMVDSKMLGNSGLQAGPALQLVYAHLFSRASLRFGQLSGRKKYISDDAAISVDEPVPDIEKLFGQDDIFKF